MLSYILKRILIFIPTLIIITLLAFVISVNAPGDPVERMINVGQSSGEISSQSANVQEQKRFWRNKLGLDLPVFYISLSTMAMPDTLYKILDKNEQLALERLVDQYGNWPQIEKFYHIATTAYQDFIKFKPDSTLTKKYNLEELSEDISQASFELLTIRSSYKDDIILQKIKKLQTIYDKYPFFAKQKEQLTILISQYDTIKTKATRWKNYIPAIKFYPNNQYHRWLFGDGGKTSNGIIRFDFGTSFKSKQPVSEKIMDKVGWSLLFTFISVFFGYLVSIPLGIKAAVQKDSRFDRISTVVLFILYSLPSFFVATLLLMTFANPDVYDIFPASGVKPISGYPEGATFFDKFKITLPYLVLPSIAYTYSSFAFLSRTMRVSILEILSQDYIRTAKAKGLKPSVVVYKHALRNALLPIITVFANIFPVAIGGSVILETIFSIPGMGHEIYTAILEQDYPMIIAVFTITGILTLIGYLISDILYAVADPRISYSK